jgi:hypothetical protein
LHTVIGDDAVNAAQADPEMGLAQFLSDDFGGGVWVQKAVAQDLTHGLVGAAIIGFGPGLLRLKGRQASDLIVLQKLIIARPAKPVMLGDSADIIFQTLPFQEHEETMGLLIGSSHGQSAGRADDLVSLGIEL